MSGTIHFRDRACQTISNYAYSISGGGVGLTAVGLATSSVVATVAGLFLVTIAVLVRYLFPSTPYRNPAHKSVTLAEPQRGAERSVSEPTSTSVVSVRAKTYEEQNHAFAEGVATYCRAFSLDGLYQSLRLVKMDTLSGLVGAQLNPDEDMVKIQCNGTLYLLIRDQSSHLANEAQNYYHLLSHVNCLKCALLRADQDLSAAHFGQEYRDFPHFMESHPVSFLETYNPHPNVGYWKNRNDALRELNVCIKVSDLSLMVLGYVGEKIVSINNVVVTFDKEFFFRILKNPNGAWAFFDIADVSESVNARGHYLFKAQDFPPGTHLVRAFIKSEHFIGIQFARKIAQINWAGGHPTFFDNYSVAVTWIRTHNKRGELLPSARQRKIGFKTNIPYRDFARDYAAAFPNS